MRRILFSLALLCSAGIAWAQDTPAPATNSGSGITCTQRLRLARATYEAGRLHELVGTILGPEASGCFDLKNTKGNSFSIQEKVDALKLLVLAYIYLEEPTLADAKMLELLKTDHFYKPNDLSDPAEYLALFKTFRTEPVFAFGGKVGANLNMTHILQNYYIWGSSPGNGKYKPGVSLSAGAFIEKEFFPNVSDKNPLKYTVLRAEPFYHIRGFTLDNPSVATFASSPGLSAATGFSKISTAWLDLNLILRVRYKPKSQWDPYVGIGPGFSLLLSAKANQAKHGFKRRIVERDGISTVESTSYSGPSVDVSSSYHPLTTTFSAVWGVNRRAGAFYVNAEVRYQYGFFNLIDTENRTQEELAFSYGMVLNDYRQSNIILCAGITYPYFNPKKLIRKSK